MNHKPAFLLLAFLFAAQLHAQSPTFQLSIGFGQPLSATDLLVCHDSSLLIVGSDSSAAGRRLVLINTDTSGNIIWQKTVLNSVSSHFESIKAIRTSDNGFCFAGFYSFPNGDSVIAVIKTDSIGQGLWALGFRPDNGAAHDAATAISESPDGHLYIGGYYYPSAIPSPVYPWLAKLDANGQVIWFKKLDVAGGRTLAVVAVSDTLIVTGINESGNLRHPVLAFTDSAGTLLKANRISPGYPVDLELADLYADTAYQVLSINLYDSLGNVAVAQCSTRSEFNQQTSVSGVMVPNHKLRVKKCMIPYSETFSLLQCSDTSAATVIGYTDGPVGLLHNFLIDTIYHSFPVAMQSFNSVPGFLRPFVLGNIPYSPAQSGIVLTQATDPKPYPFMLPCNGLFLSSLQTGDNWPDSLYLFSVSTVTGMLSHPGLSNVPTFYQADQLCGPTGLNEHAPLTPFTLFPNPSNGQFTLQGNFPAHTHFEIFDTSGRKINEVEIPEGQLDFPLTLELDAGIYIYRITSTTGAMGSGRFCIVK